MNETAHSNTILGTCGGEIQPLEFYSNFGLIRFSVWDCLLSERFGTIRDPY
jgi:GTP-binding nuclear protein Ran